MKIPAWIRGRSAPEGTNAEGLTYEEWFAATGITQPRASMREVLRQAWKDGEDPSEWRARGGKISKGWKMSNDLEGVQ